MLLKKKSLVIIPVKRVREIHEKSPEKLYTKKNLTRG